MAGTDSASYDVIVIGAGAAGLAAAHRLSLNGKRVLVIEGRGRTGGRVLTARDPSLEAPIELGAEFIHGAPSSLLHLIERMGLSFVDTSDVHLMAKAGRLESFNHYWDRLSDALARMSSLGSSDQTFADFLKAHEKAIDPKIVPFLKSYVEGFHAADLDNVSVAGLLVAEQATDEAESAHAGAANEAEDLARNARLVGGYSPLFARLKQECEAAGAEFRLATIVKRIDWQKHSITVRCQVRPGNDEVEICAPCAVITVPLGVLKAPKNSLARIEFSPEPHELREAMEALEMGTALRLTFRFRTRFWEHLPRPTKLEVSEAIGNSFCFLHAGPELDFPTWWTEAPLRVPLLVAWQGGPRARELAKLSEDERADRALATLSRMIGKSKPELRREVVAWHEHEWLTDPFSLGAYSYVRVGGLEASRRFGQAIEDTLFFAGEATVTGAARGTVNGALDSGLRAAEQILKRDSVR
jgi:monoamine oxidase